MTCEHSYDYQGRVTWPSEYPLPGSGAHARIYASAFYCVKCCEIKLTNVQEIGNTYEKVIPGTVPFASKPK